MPYIVTEACVDVKDRACVKVCPVDCIYQDSPQDRMLFIHPEQCIDCGACEMACPTFAIFAEEEVPEEYRWFIQLNRRYFTEPETVRAELEIYYANKPIN